MSRIVAIGEEAELTGYALAGVEVVAASGPELVRQAWEQVAEDVGLVLLTRAAHEALRDPIDHRRLLWVVLPA